MRSEGEIKRRIDSLQDRLVRTGWESGSEAGIQVKKEWRAEIKTLEWVLNDAKVTTHD